MINNVAKNKLTMVITTREIAFPAAFAGAISFPGPVQVLIRTD